jgi:hypothetical protein
VAPLNCLVFVSRAPRYSVDTICSGRSWRRIVGRRLKSSAFLQLVDFATQIIEFIVAWRRSVRWRLLTFDTAYGLFSSAHIVSDFEAL